ncbi:formin-like protein 5 [Salvia divinorum]|uniref:Formin-like protein n=1 Tax=Salvia divinorum TaxID=28513 RepID=A0ABD1I2G3_SALDI
MRFQMIIIRGGFIYMAFVFVLSITAVVMGLEGEREDQETLLSSLMDAGEINQEMAESLRSDCRNELSNAKKTLQDIELCFTKESSVRREELYGGSSRVKTQDARNVMCPQVKKILVDCLRDKNLVLPVTGEKKDLGTSYARYLGSVPSSPRRRELAVKSGESADPVPTIMLAIGVTASLTFIVSILLFYFCCGGSFAAGRNDERPLLSLTLSDNSIASSRKSLSLGTSPNDENLGSQSFNSSLGHTKSSGNLHLESRSLGNWTHTSSSGNSFMESNEACSLNDEVTLSNSITLSSSKKEKPLGTSADDAANSTVISTQAPPGVTGTPVFPPLKPPPGRIIPASPPPPVSSAPPPPPTAALSTPSPLAPAPPTPMNAPGAPPAPMNAPGAPPPPRAPGGPRPPGPPPPPGPRGSGPRLPGPPPPPGVGGAPRPPGVRPPRVAHAPSSSVGTLDVGGSMTKLKPFFWDKVNTSSDDSMVWSQIKGGSFQFNEEMIETLFGYAPDSKNKLPTKKDAAQEAPKFIQIIDAKKAQNLSIMLKALSVTTDEVCDALEEGNELPAELILTLLKMAPTSDEELKLRLFTGDLTLLGPAERFLKVIVDIPFAYKRLECLSFMGVLEEESASLKDSFMVLEAACTELRKNRLFLKLLEAVLKTGNRMNSGTFRGGAQAFKLDTLLKLSDVKGIDGKTTLLHFVVQEIIRGEGIRAARAEREMRSMSSVVSEDLDNGPVLDTDENLRSLGLQAVSRLGSDLESVKRAAVLEVDNLTGTVGRLGHALVKARDFLNTEMKTIEGEDKGFQASLRSFVENSEAKVRWLLEEEKRITALIKSTADYFHGSSGKVDEGFRLFSVVRSFLEILDKVCLEVKTTPAKPKEQKPKEEKPKEEEKNPNEDEKTKDEKPNTSALKEDTVAAPPVQLPAAAMACGGVASPDSSDDSDESDNSSSEEDTSTAKDDPVGTSKTNTSSPSRT